MITESGICRSDTLSVSQQCNNTKQAQAVAQTEENHSTDLVLTSTGNERCTNYVSNAITK